MRTRCVPLFVTGVLVAVWARPCFAMDDVAADQRLGARAGYVETFEGLNDQYGPGWNITLLFQQRVWSHLFFELNVGAIYYGEPLDPEIDDDITNIDNIETELRTFYFSGGAAYGIPLGGGYTLTTSVAVGIYSASLAVQTDFVADDLSDQYFGGQAGLGLAWRVGTSWSLEASSTVYYFATDAQLDDLLWFFSDGTIEDPMLLGINVGVVVDLR
jgi:hypothetical protein